MEKHIKQLQVLIEAKSLGKTIDEEYYEGIRYKLEQLEEEFPHLVLENSPSFVIGINTANKSLVKHSQLMQSVKHTYNQIEAQKWLVKLLKHGPVTVSPKMDGIALSLSYEGGYLVYAALRGDGLRGENISSFIIANSCCPIQVNKREPFIVRGELCLAKGMDRAKLAGAVRKKQAVKMEGVKFYAYSLLNSNFHSRGLAELRLCGEFNVTSFFVTDKQEQLEIKDNYSFDCDGLVIRLDSYNTSEKMGYTARYPRYMFSLKKSCKYKLATIVSMEWKINRTGYLVPICHIDDLTLDTILVKKVNGYNYRYVSQNNLGKGSIISIGRIGNSVPQIINIIKSTKFDSISHCYYCGGALTVEEIHYRCSNNNCEERLMFQAKYFFEQLQVKGMGIQTIRKYWNGSLFEFVTRIYKDQWARDLREQKLRKKILHLNPSLEDLLSAFGIVGVSKSSIKQILSGELNSGIKYSTFQHFLKSNRLSIRNYADLLSVNIDVLKNH